MTILLLCMGLLMISYGFVIRHVGSGTWFWAVWEMLGAFFLLWSWLVHSHFFARHMIIGTAFYTILSIGILAIVILCSLISSTYTDEGKPGLDYIIVLGAQIRPDGPSVVLRYRLDAAVEYLEENPDTKCIVSGGQGVNEPVTEAKGMAEYLMQHGIEADRILLEDQSRNTLQNMRFSMALMEDPEASVGIVTNDFHLYRAVQIAKKQGLQNVCGIAAHSNRLYLPNNVFRECMGILKDWIFGNL